MPRTRRVLLAGLALLLTSFVVSAAGAEPDPEAEHRAACADPAGGDWARYGNTADNRRWQDDEFGPSKDDLRSMDVAWKFRPSDAGLLGGFSNTPIVLEGCVYIATTMGDVAALNADTGDLVWAADTLVGNAVLTSANVITGSPTVVGDTIYVGVSWNSQSGNPDAAPYLAALDRWTGELLWTSTIEESQPEAFTVPAPVYHRGSILIGFSVYFDPNEERGGYAIIDASGSAAAAPSWSRARPRRPEPLAAPAPCTGTRSRRRTSRPATGGRDCGARRRSTRPRPTPTAAPRTRRRPASTSSPTR